MPLTLAQNPLGSKNKSQPCPWTEVEEGQDRGGLSRPKSGGSGRRRRGESGGGARGDRALPVCGLKRGWGWPEVCSPRRAVGGGDGRPRRRRFGEGKRQWGGLGASPSHGEASYGACSGGGGPKGRAPRWLR